MTQCKEEEAELLASDTYWDQFDAAHNWSSVWYMYTLKSCNYMGQKKTNFW